jgi:hypothetical protein
MTQHNMYDNSTEREIVELQVGYPEPLKVYTIEVGQISRYRQMLQEAELIAGDFSILGEHEDSADSFRQSSRAMRLWGSAVTDLIPGFDDLEASSDFYLYARTELYYAIDRSAALNTRAIEWITGEPSAVVPLDPFMC